MQTPWGFTNQITKISEGVEFVSTPNSCGLAVDKNLTLSDYAREQGVELNGKIFFEEDLGMHFPIVELNLSRFSIEASLKSLSFNHQNYLKQIGHATHAEIDSRKRTLTQLQNQKRKSVDELNSTIDFVKKLDNNIHFVAFNSELQKSFILKGPKRSDYIIDHEVVLGISDTIHQLGKKARFPIDIEDLDEHYQESILDALSEDNPCLINILKADSVGLNVQVLCTRRDKSKKTVVLDENNYEIIRQLTFLFGR